MARKSWLAWGVIVFLIPFQLFFNYTLNSFFHFGALSGDSGLFAHLLWHGNWQLTTPIYYGNLSFFGQHFSPFLLIFSRLSYFIPLQMVEYYAVFAGAIYALLAVALLYALISCIKPRNQWQMAGFAVLALAFPFNGVLMSGIDFIHFEYAIPLGIFLFLVSFAQHRPRLTLAFFVFTLSIREDAGVHLSAVLGMLALIRFIEQRSISAIRKEIGFIAVALAYSGITYWLTSYVAHRSGLNSMFITVYSGLPPYAHLNWQLLIDRLEEIFKTRSYLWLPMLIALGYGIYRRNYFLIVPYVAYLPWCILNWTAKYEVAGVLDAYYAFPLTLTFVWPLVAAMWRYGFPLPATALRETLTLQALFIGLGLVMYNPWNHRLEFSADYGARWGSYRLQLGAENREVVRDFARKIDAGAGDLGSILADDHIFSLIRGDYKDKPMISLLFLDKYPGKSFDTIIYPHPEERPPKPRLLEEVRRNRLTHHYCLIGTTICLFTNRAVGQFAPYSSMMMEVQPPPEALVK